MKQFLPHMLCLAICVNYANGDLLGKFVFQENQVKQEDGHSSLSVLHQPASVQFAPNAGPIPSTEISSVLSLALGLSVYKDISWNGLQAGSLFSRPKAVVMINVDGLPKDDKLKLKATERFAVSISDEASTISDMMSVSSKVSLASHVNTIFEGKSRTVSVSADEKLSAAGFSNGGLSTTSFWNGMSDSWRVIHGGGDNEVSLTKYMVMKRIPQILKAGFTYNQVHKTVSVNTNALQFTYNLDDKADFNFFSELVYINWQCEELAVNKKTIKDNAPDVYLFTISSLKGLEKKYGAHSKQLQAALLLLEKFIPDMIQNFVSLYGGNVLITSLSVKSDVSYFKEHKQDIEHVLKSLVNVDEYVKDFENLVPELHVESKLESQARRKLCEAVHTSISKLPSSLKFKCATEEEVHKVLRRSLLAASTGTDDKDNINLASVYDEMFPVIFNMWFWLIVLLMLAVYAISLSMWHMDPGRDSIIYRLTQQKIKAE